MTREEELLAALKALVDQVGQLPNREHDRDFNRAYSVAHDLAYGKDEFTERFMERAKS